MIKVPSDERDINIAALADWFAVVYGFENGEQARMFLHQPGQCVEKAGPRVRSKCAPLRRGRACRAHGSIDVRGGTLSNGGQLFAGRRIECVEIFSRGRGLPGSVDEVGEAAAMAVQPALRFLGIFGSRAVLHGQKFFGDTHSVRLDSSGIRKSTQS